MALRRSYKAFQIDVFTRERFSGNPAGVVLNADGLSVAEMQKIARELNNSETAFMLSPTSADHDVWVRFFTPTCEVPLAADMQRWPRITPGHFTEGASLDWCGKGAPPASCTSESFATIRTPF